MFHVTIESSLESPTRIAFPQHTALLAPTTISSCMQVEHNHEVGLGTLFSGQHGDSGALTSNSSGSKALLLILANLCHLDLSGRVSQGASEPQASGGFADIFLERYDSPDGKNVRVAVKRARIHRARRAEERDRLFKRLAEELKVWSKLSHPNVLPLLGFVWRGQVPCIVSEWMSNGTLTQHMENHPGCDGIYMSVGVARGLKYLHDLDIVHCDIKADNVLISPEGGPLLCDFGISRCLIVTQTVGSSSSRSVNGTLPWMSPELLPASGGHPPEHSKASDVWAFGMLEYELLTGKHPFENLKYDVNILLAIHHGQLPQRPDGVWLFPLDRVWTLCAPHGGCWDNDPTRRPSMSRILEYLELCYELATRGSYHDLADFANEQWLVHDAHSQSPKPFTSSQIPDIQLITETESDDDDDTRNEAITASTTRASMNMDADGRLYASFAHVAPQPECNEAVAMPIFGCPCERNHLYQPLDDTSQQAEGEISVKSSHYTLHPNSANDELLGPIQSTSSSADEPLQHIATLYRPEERRTLAKSIRSKILGAPRNALTRLMRFFSCTRTADVTSSNPNSL